MNDAPDADEVSQETVRGLWLLYGLAAILAGVELVVWLAPLLGLQASNLRSVVLEYGAFWPGLLGNWVPNYPHQPILMFATYGFLHSGPVHLVVNLLTLFALGRIVLDRIGPTKSVALYLGAIVGGAFGYGLLAFGPQPMVGASGALFGLAGAVLAWEYLDRFTTRLSLWPVARAVGYLVALNLLLWWAMQGLLAWQTHLGGFIVGWVLAMLLDPTGRRTDHDHGA